MSTTEPDGVIDLQAVYSDLAAALGAAQQRAGDAPDEVAAMNERIQQRWSQAVQRAGAGMDPALLQSLPPVVTPDPPASTDIEIDIDAVLDHVDAFSFAAGAPAAPQGRRFGFTGSLRTAALGWCAAAVVLAVLLGVTVSGSVVVPAFIPPVAVVLLLGWRGAGRAPGALWAVGMLPLVFLLAGQGTTAAAALAFVVLVEGFACLIQLSARDDEPWGREPKARRRPLEIELVVFSIAAWTTKVDVVALLVLACLAGLLWRRPWTAALAALVSGLAVFIELAPWTNAGADFADLLVYAVLTAHWVRAVVSRPWRASRLSATELGLSLGGRAVRGSWRAARRTADNVLPGLPVPGSPGGRAGGPGSTGSGATGPAQPENEGYRYCWTCHQQTKHEPMPMSPPVCRRCAAGATTFDRGMNIYEDCATCRQKTMHTHDGTCLSCRGRGR